MEYKVDCYDKYHMTCTEANTVTEKNYDVTLNNLTIQNEQALDSATANETMFWNGFID
jgi:hypothetical protein